MADEQETQRPWIIVDYSGDDKGWIEIRGPDYEAIATIFPHAGKGGVGVKVARQNATLIINLVNGLVDGDMAIRPALTIQGNVGGTATVTARIEFDDFDKAMEFNTLIVEFLTRELSDQRAKCASNCPSE